MTVKELFDILEDEIKMGRGDFKVVIWDTDRVDATGALRDSHEKEFYICTGN